MGFEAPTRVLMPDCRDTDQFLRVTWHAEGRVVVFSIWRQELCVAAIPIGVEHLGALVAHLGHALAAVATVGESATNGERGPWGRDRSVWGWVRSLHHRAQPLVVSLRDRRARPPLRRVAGDNQR